MMFLDSDFSLSKDDKVMPICPYCSKKIRLDKINSDYQRAKEKGLKLIIFNCTHCAKVIAICPVM